jgi:cell shape-determining protein MreD
MRRIQLNAEKRDIVFRSLIALAMLFGTALLQTSFLPWVGFFDAIPDILLIFTVGVGFFNGARVGIPFGIGAGLVGYFLGGGRHAEIILLYALAGILFCMYFTGRKYLSWCIHMMVAVLFKAGWSLLMCLVFSPVPRPLAALWHSVLPELLGTLLLSLVLYVPIRAAARLLKRKSEM